MCEILKERGRRPTYRKFVVEKLVTLPPRGATRQSCIQVQQLRKHARLETGIPSFAETSGCVPVRLRVTIANARDCTIFPDPRIPLVKLTHVYMFTLYDGPPTDEEILQGRFDR